MGPVHQTVGTLLGHRAADWMNDRLLEATTTPPGLAHLERPDLGADLTMARDFDLGITAPPLHISMGFIADGLRLLVAGAASAVVLARFRWWAPLVVGGAWLSTHWLLRESGVWKDRRTDAVQTAQRHADYAFRMAVDSPAAKEVRLFGLADWVLDRFTTRRTELFELQWEATRLRQRSTLSSLAVVTAANALVFWRLTAAAVDGTADLAAVVVYLLAAVGTCALAFGGLSWALDAASAPADAVARLGSALATAGALGPEPSTAAADAGPAGNGRGDPVTTDGPSLAPSADPERMRAVEIRFDRVGFSYPTGSTPVLDGLDLTIPAGSSLAIVGRNGSGKTTLAKLLCRFYQPDDGAILIDGVDLASLDLVRWRRRVAAVFQDFVRHERSLRYNVAPGGADDADVVAALAQAGASDLADLDVVLARGYPGGTDLSGGQWQRVALARVLCGVRLGAGLVLLDEPTAQLDVRGEAEIFERLLDATRHCTTVLVSHRFSTVRRADRIAVVEGGRVIELGTHDELMAARGRYRTMYDLQASRFVERDEHGEPIAHDRLD
jgi:ABC-type multidrug transport system fused ATPase/permease subunit